MGLVIDDEEAEAAEKAAKEALDADAPWNEPDEDPPPPAPEGEDAEPELDADGNPVDTPAPVDYKGIAKRLAMATLPVEGEEEVDHLKLVCDACDDIRSLNIVAEDAYGETASKIVYFRVVELLFRHLRAVPAPLPPTPEPELDDEGNPVTQPAEDDKENERELTAEERHDEQRWAGQGVVAGCHELTSRVGGTLGGGRGPGAGSVQAGPATVVGGGIVTSHRHL